jgi:transposase InsO family protein
MNWPPTGGCERRATSSTYMSSYPRATVLSTRSSDSVWRARRKGGEEKPQRHTYRTVVSGFPFQRLSIDFVGPLKKTSRGNTVILTVKDTFTKWVEAFALPRATAESVATTLTNEIFARFGYPDEIHSDRGSQFTSHLITQLAELIGVHITWTPAYHPQSNPVERAHRDLKAGLRAALETVGGDEWDTCLPQVLFAFRTSPARGTGISPFHALFGRHPNVPLGILEAPPRMGRPLADYVVDLQARMEAVHRWARENLVKEVHRQQRAYSSMPRSFRARRPGLALRTADKGREGRP